MAYMLTAIMSGGVAALISFFTGSALSQVAWNYVLFGHLGMTTLALAIVAASMIEHKSKNQA